MNALDSALAMFGQRPVTSNEAMSPRRAAMPVRIIGTATVTGESAEPGARPTAAERVMPRPNARPSPPRPDPAAPAAGATDSGCRVRPARLRTAGARRLAPASLAAGLLVALTAQFAAPAHAQSETILVGNTGQSASHVTAVGELGAENYTLAQQITTGSSSGGYVLSSVVLEIHDFAAGSDEVRVRIYTNGSNDRPGSSLHVLTNPGTLANGSNTFAAPANATLDPDTRYHIVADAPSGAYGLRRTISDAEDASGQDDWSIRDDFWFRSGGTWFTNSESLRIQVKGTVTAVASTDATLSALALANAADGSPVALNETFVSGTTDYTADVANAVTRITVTPAPGDDGAAVEYLDENDAVVADADPDTESREVDLAVGANTIKVKVTAEDATTTVTYELTVNRAAGNTPATGGPSIFGVPQEGEELGVAEGTLADADGLPATFPDDYTFQWVRDDDGSETWIAGATTNTYTVAAADVGKTIRVIVSFTDDAGTDETRTSNAYPSVPAGATVVAPQGACPSDADWCANMEVGAFIGSVNFFGFNHLRGSLDDATIEYGGETLVVKNILIVDTSDSNDFVQIALDAFAPRGTVFDLGGTRLTADAAAETATRGRYRWRRPAGFFWVAESDTDSVTGGQRVTVGANLPPGLDTATVDGTSLVLTYDQQLDTASVPAASAYSVKVDGGAGAAPSSVAITGKTVTLTLATAVTSSRTVTVSYTVPADNPVQDESDLAAEAFTDRAVTNDTIRSSIATLGALALANPADGTAVAMNETFASGTTTYTADVTNAVSRITVTPTTSHDDATVEYVDGSDNAIPDAGGEPGHQVALDAGANIINVKVTAEDLTTVQAYTLTVTRAAATPTHCATDDIWCGFPAFGGRFTSLPEARLAMSKGQREHSVGWRLRREMRGDRGALELALEARRKASANDNAPGAQHSVGFRITARW